RDAAGALRRAPLPLRRAAPQPVHGQCGDDRLGGAGADGRRPASGRPCRRTALALAARPAGGDPSRLRQTGSEGMNGRQAKIAVAGAGPFGAALANVAAAGGGDVTLIGRNGDAMAEMQRTRRNEKALPGIPLAPTLACTADVEAVRDAGIVLF